MGPALPTTTTGSPSSSFVPLSTAPSSPTSKSPPAAAMSNTVSSPPPDVTPTTIEKLPANIPRLEHNGSNWAIFKMRFSNAMKVTRRWGYFTGIHPCPEPTNPTKPTKEETAAIVQWEYEDSVASYYLSQRLPDITEMRLANCSTTKERWAMVTKEYQAKSTYAQADLHQAFLEMRCTKGGDVREFLASLCCKREELAAAGVTVTDKEYERTILKGIPSELATFASHLLSSALIIHSASPVDLDALINQICEEADRLKSRAQKHKVPRRTPPMRPYPPQHPTMGGNGAVRANAIIAANLAIGPKSAAPPKPIRGKAQALRPRRHKVPAPSRKTNQLDQRTSFMTSKEMGSGWQQMRPSTAHTLFA